MTVTAASPVTNTSAHTEVAAHAEDHGPTLLGLSAEGWVYTGVSIFFIIAFVFFKAHRKILDGLDARIADTRRELDEAATLRAEAEALLVAAKAAKKGACHWDRARWVGWNATGGNVENKGRAPGRISS